MSRLEQIIEQLVEVSHNPRKQLERYQSEGKKVVGCFPPYTPQELVTGSRHGSDGNLGKPDRELSGTSLCSGILLSDHAE